MLITGIVLQLIAGTILGLTKILPNSVFQSANSKIQRFIFLPLSQRRFQRAIPLLGGLTVPFALLLLIFLSDIFGTPSDISPVESLVGIIFGCLLTSTLYLLLLQKIAQMLSGVPKARQLPDTTYINVMLKSNLLLIPILVAFSGLGYAIILLLQNVSTENIAIEILLAFPTVFAVFVSATSLLSIPIALLFIIFALIMKLVAAMAQADKLIWIIVLSIFVTGGALLIVEASLSNT